MTTVMRIDVPGGAPGPRAIVGAGAILATTALVRIAGVERTASVVHRWIRRRAKVPATVAEARAASAFVDGGARWLPCRVACLERSLTTCAVLAARGRRVHWLLGVRVEPPLAVHAWIVADGVAIGETEDIATAYRPLLTI